MNVRKLLVSLALIFPLVPMKGLAQSAQSAPPSQDSSQQNSLADAARKAREQKKDQPKPAKVFTNEDLAGLKGTISVVGNEPPSQQSAEVHCRVMWRHVVV